MADETPQGAAATPDVAQPVPQAVESAPAVPASTDQTQAPAPAETAPTSTEKLWAGKYKAPEILEEAYTHAQSENTRMAQELSALRKTQTPAQPTTPAAQTYSREQLETWKEQWLVKAATEPDKAVEAARQVVLIDAKLREQDLSQYASKTTAESAYQQLRTDVTPALVKYEKDLQPGQPLFNEASAIHRQALAAGRPDDEFTRAASVAFAILKAGKLGTGDVAQAASDATKHLNQAIKGAAAAGSGAANVNAAPPLDFKAMSNKDFAEYRKSQGVGK